MALNLPEATAAVPWLDRLLGRFGLDRRKPLFPELGQASIREESVHGGF